METSLHRQLKAHYARPGDAVEVKLGKWRIDVVRGKQLVEIQHGPLGAIRDKVRTLVETHRVLVVKPIVVRKVLIKRNRKNGKIVSRRVSPGRWTVLDIFDDLVHFTRAFPHKRLTLEVLPVEIEEWRYPKQGRIRFRRRDYKIEDQKLATIGKPIRLRTAADLRRLADCSLPEPFDTAALAAGLGINRWHAQRIAYCFRHMGIAQIVGKQRNALLYAFTDSQSAAA